MHEPPKKARKGLKNHVRDINALREFVLKTRLMPDQGFEETASGVKPPIAFSEHIPQFSPGFSFDTLGTFFYFRRGGFVNVPFNGETLDEDEDPSVSSLPYYASVPIAPRMIDYYSGLKTPIVRPNSEIDSGQKTPVLLAPSGEETVVILEVVFKKREEVIGMREKGDETYWVGMDCDVPVADATDRFFTGSTSPPTGVGRTGDYVFTNEDGEEETHNHAGESSHTHLMYNVTFDHRKLGAEFRQATFAVHDPDDVQVYFMSKDTFDGSADSVSGDDYKILIPLGWFELSSQGKLVSLDWFAEGQFGLIKYPTGHIKSPLEADRDPAPITFPTDEEKEDTTYALPQGED